MDDKDKARLREGINSFIETYTGRIFFPLNPDPGSIDILDIAHALSNQCRFTGHVRHFYSVAEHCIRGSLVAPPGFELVFLLHDAGEAYLSDIARPVKHQPEFANYRTYEARIERAVEQAFKLQPNALEHPTIKEIDRRMLRTEQRDLMPFLPQELDPRPEAPFDFRIYQTLGPREAETLYLKRFEELRTKPVAHGLGKK